MLLKELQVATQAEHEAQAATHDLYAQKEEAEAAGDTKKAAELQKQLDEEHKELMAAAPKEGTNVPKSGAPKIPKVEAMSPGGKWAEARYVNGKLQTQENGKWSRAGFGTVIRKIQLHDDIVPGKPVAEVRWL